MLSAKQTPSNPLVDVVLDIDATLATGSTQDFKQFPQDQIITAASYPHFIHPGVIEFIRYLYSPGLNIRVSFYSAGASERNLPFVKELLIRALGRARYNEIRTSVKVLSRDYMVRDQKHSAKDLKLILQYQNSTNTHDLSQVVLVDDNTDFVHTGQHRNLLRVPFLTLEVIELDDRNILKLFRMNHIFYVTGLLKHILNHNPVTRELYELQFDSAEKDGQLFLSKSLDVQRSEFYYTGLQQLQEFNPGLQFYQQGLFIPWLHAQPLALNETAKALSELNNRRQQKTSVAQTTTTLATVATPSRLPQTTLAPRALQSPTKEDLVKSWKIAAKNGDITAENNLAAHYRFTRDTEQLFLLFKQCRQNPTVIFHAMLNNQLQEKTGIVDAFNNLARHVPEFFISLFLQEEAPSFELLNQLLNPINAKLIAGYIRYYEIVLTNGFFAQPFGIAGRLICEYFFEYLRPDEQYKRILADIREKSTQDLMKACKTSLDEPQRFNDMGDYYFAKSVHEPEYLPLAFEHYRLAAKANNREAQCRLGYHHEHEKTEPEKNQKLAVDYYSKAAANGSADAQEHLGDCYQQGRLGLKRDDKMAVELYRQAAEQKHPNALCKLSFCYRYGLGVPADKNLAEELLKKAEAQGQVRETTYNSGIAVDSANAITWYHGAAEQGHYTAQVELAFMYIDGIGVKQDLTKAALHLRRATEQKKSEYPSEQICCRVLKEFRDHPSVAFHMVMALNQTTGTVSKEHKDAFVAASLKFPTEFQAMLKAESAECRAVAEKLLEQANTTRVRPVNDASVPMASTALLFSSSTMTSAQTSNGNNTGLSLGNNL